MSNIAIVGDGAIGLLYSQLLSTDNQVTLITRNAKPKTQYYYQRGELKQAINVEVLNSANLDQLTAIETVIFAVKAYQVNDAVAQLIPYLSSSCKLILSHNGMSDLQPILSKLHSQQALFFLITQLAGFKIASTTVIHTGNGQSILGSCNNTAEKKADTLLQQLSAIPQISYTGQINLIRWKKLLINIAINPLTAHYNIKNGELAAPKYSSEVLNLLTEACMVANAQGINIKLCDALARAYQVMTATAQNYSSMQQDITHTRPTEIDAMCGYICQQAAKLGIKTPYNQLSLDRLTDKKSAN
ncbi:2-dehydropantoate 2-reductase [Pseudoalteromonas shioyasakiensis]|uniref:ketopantoate reductase family protein n=1 Tax=Pseudoalteromonas shioyasakiensis TaxID=1190813 RepID=UPI0021178EE6|nr:2-dehydropantoate 2-reductase [Pseudoalteromonas shioyasakiensis]MCQ8878179.1 2-dehydropantoate 2-reductase [Pseudoalteromonas shioyasakiensis]